MNPHLIHQLADDHLAVHRAAVAGSSCRLAPMRGHRLRARFGLLLVEAGLHLVTSAEPTRRPAPLAF